MAKVASVVLLAFGFLTLSVIVHAISVPAVPEPTCVGGWNIHGVYYPREQGGCCRGTECCQYPAFSDNLACVSVSPTPSACSGLDCCKYEEYKNTPLCVVSSPTLSACSGLDCCELEQYQDTPLCIVSPTPSDDECTTPPPECPVGSRHGGSIPMLLDPAIAGGSKCRGACGPDCPDSCVDVKDQKYCMPDSKGECFYVCSYSNVRSCGLHEGCEKHDDCYDACAAKGETRMCLPWLGLCHCSCDLDCVLEYGPGNCLQWMGGNGPTQSHELYSSPPLRSRPHKACPAGTTYWG